MEKPKYIYLVGTFDNLYKPFSLYTHYKNGTTDYTEAEKMLTDIYKKHPGGHNIYKIFRVAIEDMKPVETKKALTDYALIKDRMDSNGLLDSFYWYGDSITKRDENNKSNCVRVQQFIGFNEGKKIISIEFGFSFYNNTQSQQQFETDLGNFAKYAMTPKIQKILDGMDTDWRVEFKLFGRKLVKGFIKKGVQNETK